MLEDYAQGLDLRDSSFDSPLKKVARVLHLTDGKVSRHSRLTSLPNPWCIENNVHSFLDLGKKQVTAVGVVAVFILIFVIIWI